MCVVRFIASGFSPSCIELQPFLNRSGEAGKKPDKAPYGLLSEPVRSEYMKKHMLGLKSMLFYLVLLSSSQICYHASVNLGTETYCRDETDPVKQTGGPDFVTDPWMCQSYL